MHFITVIVPNIMAKWPKIKDEKYAIDKVVFRSDFCQFVKQFWTIQNFDQL